MRAGATRQFWTAAEDAIIRAQYPHLRAERLVALLPRRSLASIYKRAKKLGVEKAPSFLVSRESGRLDGTLGAAYRFKPGQAPWSKGKRIGSRGRSSETQFKPGVRQGVAERLYKPIGAERISRDGYLERKVNDDRPFYRRWRAVHLLLWEAAHGPVPGGHALTFVNGDRTDIRLENLALIPRGALMRRNTVHNYPQPIPQLLQLKGALVRKINRRSQPA